MPDKAWKAFERFVASFFGTVRTSLSGGNGKVSRSDSHHPDLFISCKHTRAGHKQLFDLVAEERIKADREGKVPVVVIGRNGRGKPRDMNTLVVIPISHLKKFTELNLSVGAEDE